MEDIKILDNTIKFIKRLNNMLHEENANLNNAIDQIVSFFNKDMSELIYSKQNRYKIVECANFSVELYRLQEYLQAGKDYKKINNIDLIKLCEYINLIDKKNKYYHAHVQKNDFSSRKGIATRSARTTLAARRKMNGFKKVENIANIIKQHDQLENLFESAEEELVFNEYKAIVLDVMRYRINQHSYSRNLDSIIKGEHVWLYKDGIAMCSRDTIKKYENKLKEKKRLIKLEVEEKTKNELIDFLSHYDIYSKMNDEIKDKEEEILKIFSSLNNKNKLYNF